MAPALTKQLEVVFEDDYLACVVKPRGLSTEGERPSASSLLPRSLRRSAMRAVDVRRPVCAHRLDKAAGGLLLVAKTLLTFAGLTAMFQERRIRKRYAAVVCGELRGRGEVDTPVDGRKSRTEWRSVACCERRLQTLVELWPVTGRQHQLRKHMLELGHAILGDTRYMPQWTDEDAADGMWLWAESLAFEHPMTGQAMQFLLHEPSLLHQWRQNTPSAPRSGSWEQPSVTSALSYGRVRRASAATPSLERTAQSRGEDPSGSCAFSVGDRGVLFTTEAYAGAPGGSARAALSWLELVRFLEGGGGDARPPLPEAAPSSATAAEGSALRFAPSVEVTRGAGFLKFFRADDVPSRLVQRAFLRHRNQGDLALDGSERPAPYLCQVLPVDHTCEPSLGSLASLAARVLPPHFAGAPRSWALVFRARGASALSKLQVLELVDEIITGTGLPHPVDLGSPQRCVLVEVNPHFCGLSVLESWRELNACKLERPAQ